jgi:hypothetical protein
VSTYGTAEAPPTLEVAGLDENAVATHQEAVPLPYLAGEGPGVLRWISPIYNPRAVEAPQTPQEKK